MNVDIYIAGKGSKHVADYLSAKMRRPYDTDGVNIFLMENVSLEEIPARIFVSHRMSQNLEIRKNEGKRRGNVIFPKRKENSYDA